MEYVRDTDEAAYFTRSRELAFLANTLLAGCSVQSRPFTPQEASDAAAEHLQSGARILARALAERDLAGRVIAAALATRPQPHRPTRFPPDSFLIDHDLVTAFEVGWSVLHQDVSLFVAQQLISTLDDFRLRRSRHPASGSPRCGARS